MKAQSCCTALPLWVVLALAAGCWHNSDQGSAGAGGDADSDGDGDADMDSDADGDADADGDGDADGDVAGELAWAQRITGSGWIEMARVRVGPAGAISLCGRFTGSAIFGEGQAGETTLASAGGDDVFLASYTDDGSLAWAVRAGGPGKDACADISIRADGSVMATGTFEEIATFGEGGAGEASLTSAGDEDIFVALYQSDGELDWVMAEGCDLDDFAAGIAVHDGGGFVLTGRVEGTIWFTGYDGHRIALIPGETAEMFLAGYDEAGTLSWVESVAVTDELGITPWAIDAAPDGSSVITGGYLGDPVFGEGDANETMLPSASDGEVFVARYFEGGAIAWASGALSDGGEGCRGTDVAVLDDGRVAFAALVDAPTVFGLDEPNEIAFDGHGGFDAALGLLDANGELLWARQDGGEGADRCHGVAEWSDGSVFGVGVVEGEAVFAEGLPGEATVGAPDDGPRGYIVHYDQDGDLLEIGALGGAGQSECRSVAITGDGRVVVTGDFKGTVVFDEGQPGELSLVSDVQGDAFIACYLLD